MTAELVLYRGMDERTLSLILGHVSASKDSGARVSMRGSLPSLLNYYVIGCASQVLVNESPSQYMRNAKRTVFRLMARAGIVLTITGCCGLVLGLGNFFNLDMFAYGLSSGIRIVGSVAIAGCLLSAVGYGALEYLQK